MFSPISEKMNRHHTLSTIRIFVTGVTSIHGWPLFRYLSEVFQPENLLGMRSPKMHQPSSVNLFSGCITDRETLRSVRDNFKPTHIIHCAGVCDLDVCEERPHWAHQMNTVGSSLIAKVFGDTAHIIYLSTDLIFSGLRTPPDGYCELSKPDPLTVAGRTIREGEEELVSGSTMLTLIRLGLPIGASLTGNKGAFDFIDSRLRRSLPVTLFRDEWRSCTCFGDIADVVMKVISDEVSGLFHCGGPVKRSLHEIGKIVLQRGGYNKSLLKGIFRIEELVGPPRMGDVSLNSNKISRLLGRDLLDPFVISSR